MSLTNQIDCEANSSFECVWVNDPTEIPTEEPTTQPTVPTSSPTRSAAEVRLDWRRGLVEGRRTAQREKWKARLPRAAGPRSGGTACARFFSFHLRAVATSSQSSRLPLSARVFFLARFVQNFRYYVLNFSVKSDHLGVNLHRNL